MSVYNRVSLINSTEPYKTIYIDIIAQMLLQRCRNIESIVREKGLPVGMLDSQETYNSG